MAQPSDRDLQRYFDGELDPSASARIEEVAREDAATRRRLAELAELRGALRDISHEACVAAPLGELWPRVLARLDDLEQEERTAPARLARFAAFRPKLVRRLALLIRKRLVIAASAAAAAAVAAALLAHLLWGSGGTAGSWGASIETIEVGPGVSSAIYTIEADEAGERVQTTVLWLSEDSDGGGQT